VKKIFVTASLVCSLFSPGFIQAQDQDKLKNNSETDEIIIRNKGDKKMDLNVEINGDQINVNGVPLAEYKDDHIKISRRKMMIRNGDNSMSFDFNQDGNMDLGNDENNQWNFPKVEVRPFLGVTTEKTDEGGALVKEVTKESPAEKAGIKKNDVITKVDDNEIKNAGSLSQVILTKNPGDEVKIYYKRDGKEHSKKIKLGEKKGKKSFELVYGDPNGMMKMFNMPPVEMNRIPPIPRITPDPEGTENEYNPWMNNESIMPQQKKIGLKIQDMEQGGGVRVIDVDPGSAAGNAGLIKDDLITEIDGKIINNTDDARGQLRTQEGKTSYKIKAQRNGNVLEFEIKFPKNLKTADL